MTDAILERQEPLISTGEEDVRQFLSEIRAFPLLSVQEERDLARRCAQGDEDAIRELVDSNLRLVVSIAKEYAGRGVALLDLIQEGSIGLLVAARKFDYTLENRFSTYATKWIRQGVTRCLMNHGCMIRVPLHTAERIRKVTQAQKELLQKHGTEPTLAQIAEHTEIPEGKVAELLRLRPEVCSLDIPAGEDEDTLGMLLEDVRAPQPQEELVRRELERMVRQLLSALNERQSRVLRLRSGMEDGVCHSLEQVGRILGVSKERARQIERQAIDKLQQLGAGMGLEEFLI